MSGAEKSARHSACIITLAEGREGNECFKYFGGRRAVTPIGVESFFTSAGGMYGHIHLFTGESARDGADGLTHLEVGFCVAAVAPRVTFVQLLWRRGLCNMLGLRIRQEQPPTGCCCCC